MIARLSAFVIWALVALATVFWGMRFLVRPDPVPMNAVVVSETAQVRGDLSRLLGAEPVAAVAAAPAMSSRFRLLGVMAAKASPEGMTPGVALISIDGKPARAFTSGARVEDQLVLQNVSLRSASIGSEQGGSAFTLEIPALPAPATGALPKLSIEGASPPPPAPAMAQRPMSANETPPPQPPGPRMQRPGMGNPNSSR
jgi:general secretion pathway protein C